MNRTIKVVYVGLSSICPLSTGERGFYIDIKSTPFPVAESFDMLIMKIDEFNIAEYQSRTTEFLSKIGNVETGKAAEYIVNKLVMNVNEG